MVLVSIALTNEGDREPHSALEGTFFRRSLPKFVGSRPSPHIRSLLTELGLYYKLICVTHEVEDAARSLQSTRELRQQARLARNGHWLACVVFGVLTLAALPFYVLGSQAAIGSCSHRIGPHAFLCSGLSASRAPLPGPFSSHLTQGNFSAWETLYWALAVLVGYGAVVFYYEYRWARLGVQGRIWPAVGVGLCLFLVVLIANGGGHELPPFPDFWVRGLGALVVIAVGLCVLAALERSVPFGIFAVGFFGLALLSCLYDEVNIFQRLDLAGLFQGSANALPNLLIPGLYLLIGGFGFWVAGRRAVAAR
jgi:hypothetical protein